MSEIFERVRALCVSARGGAASVANADGALRNAALNEMADAIVREKDKILAANREDLSRAAENGVPRVMLDRLTLTDARVRGIADGVRALIALPDPLTEVSRVTRPSGITIVEKRVPFGLIAMIYEARPNVTADAAAIAIKSGNAVVLRGGKEAICTNRAMVSVLKEAISAVGISPEAVALVEDTERESATALLSMRGLVDLLIPRGGKGLIQNCVENAKVPIIETGAGNCHVYVDAEADMEKALAVAINAKCQRPSVCNAAESLLCHRAVAREFLPAFFARTREWGLSLRGCPATCEILSEAEPATAEDFYTEFNDFVMSVKIVDSVEEAVSHINETGTRHSEAILTENAETAAYFMSRVDAAAVYHNASTRFTDGGEFGLGAEIGISTQKLHARGPMGTEALTTTKYFVMGNGAIRK